MGLRWGFSPQACETFLLWGGQWKTYHHRWGLYMEHHHSKEREVPEYIQLDDKNKTAKLIRVPKFAEVPFPVIMEPSLVIEYYSR